MLACVFVVVAIAAQLEGTVTLIQFTEHTHSFRNFVSNVGGESVVTFLALTNRNNSYAAQRYVV